MYLDEVPQALAPVPFTLPTRQALRPSAPPPALIPVPPAISIALPDGGQAQIPGFLWPNADIWTLAERPVGAGGPPIEIRRIDRKLSNVYTGAWHDLGAETRLFSYTAFALYVRGEVVAVATAATSVNASVDQSFGLDRQNTVEPPGSAAPAPRRPRASCGRCCGCGATSWRSLTGPIGRRSRSER